MDSYRGQPGPPPPPMPPSASLSLLRLIPALLLLMPAPSVAAQPAPPYPRIAGYVSSYVTAEVHKFQSHALGSSAVRDLAAAAWALLALSPQPPSAANVTLAAGMLDACFAKQLPDGRFPWTFDSNVSIDGNGVQFFSLPMLRAVVHYGPRFGAAALARWRGNMTMAAVASFAEGDGPGTEAQPYYTNIATMRLVNLHLFAQVLGNATLRAQADAATAAWSSLVDGAGVHEYSSPTYTAVAIDNLIAGAASLADAAVAALLRRYALFLLAHAAAGFFSPARELAGPHSRDYDFLYGSAGMDYVYALSGIAAAGGVADADAFVLNQDPITEALLYASAVRGDFPRLPAGLLALAAPPAKAGDWRVMQASYSATPGSARATDGCDAYVFTARAASLGVSSLYYVPQDKMVVAQLALAPGGAPPAASPRLAQVTLVQDSFDAPYGMVKTADGSGHEKPTHLKATVAAVQDRGLALVLNDLTMAIEGSARGGPFDSLAANVVLPAGAGVDAVYTESGGRVRNVSRGAPDVPLRLGETVAVRSAGGIVAWRLAFADGLAGYAPTSALKFDGPPGTDAARAVTYLYRGPNTTFPNNPPPSRSLLVIGVGEAATDAEAVDFVGGFAALAVTNDAANASDWRAAVAPAPPGAWPRGAPPGFESSLGAAMLVPIQKKILAREVNGSAVHVPAAGALELRTSDGGSRNITTATFASAEQ